MINDTNQISACWKCKQPTLRQHPLCGNCGAHQIIADIYQPVELLGEGKFSWVYKAYNKDLFDTPPEDETDYFAIKVFKNDAPDDPAIKRELKLLRGLPVDNPNLVRILPGTCRRFIVMEYIKGKNLHDLIRTSQGQAKLIQNFNTFLLGLTNGLTGIHTSGMIHRDFKPKNVLVTDADLIPKIVDMGLGKLVTEGSPGRSKVGSLEIMAPEVLRSSLEEDYDKPVDLWALGVVIYFIWTATYPFGTQIVSNGTRDKDWKEFNAIVQSILNERPTPPQKLNLEVPPYVVDLVHDLLIKDPHNRLKPAEAVRSRLSEIPYQAGKDPTSYSLLDYQQQLSHLYANRNASVPAPDLLGRVIGHMGYLYNATKQNPLPLATFEDHMPRAFAWLCALTEAAGWTTNDVIAFKYNGVCPYCGQKPCTMEHPIANEQINRELLATVRSQRAQKKAAGNKTREDQTIPLAQWTFAQFAKMFDDLYGEHNKQHKVQDLIAQFYSEASEFYEAYFDATKRRDPDATAIMYLELADLFAWSFAIHNALDADEGWFEKAFWDLFQACPKQCGTIPCSCPPVSEDLRLRNWRLSEATLSEEDVSAPKAVN